MTGGTYDAAVQLVRAADLLRVLKSVGRDTVEDHNSVREALAHWDGVTPPRSRQASDRAPARLEPTIDRYLKTGVWR
jgi:hypothetical protein